MTQNSNQSVRNAEAAKNSNRIPTFDEVYAMPYVRESIESVLDQNVRQYQVLMGYKDDLRQEILIYINNILPSFDPAKSSFNTFFRRILHSAMCNAREPYFRKKHLTLTYAEDVDAYEMTDEDASSSLSIESRRAYERLAKNNVEQGMFCRDVREMLEACPPEIRKFAQLLAEGYTRREIAARMGMAESTLRCKHLRILRKVFTEKSFKDL